ncbi:MAG: hypothetical protein ACRELC_02330, partial [Gemmatimonadota bacterium]
LTDDRQAPALHDHGPERRSAAPEGAALSYSPTWKALEGLGVVASGVVATGVVAASATSAAGVVATARAVVPEGAVTVAGIVPAVGPVVPEGVVTVAGVVPTVRAVVPLGVVTVAGVVPTVRAVVALGVVTVPVVVEVLGPVVRVILELPDGLVVENDGVHGPGVAARVRRDRHADTERQHRRRHQDLAPHPLHRPSPLSSDLLLATDST